MLTKTYIHSPGIGPATERKLWAAGFESWDQCLSSPESLPVTGPTRQSLLQTLAESAEALERQDPLYFARALPAAYHWRALSHFSRVGYLDIETDGGTLITVIGLYDGVRVRQYVCGDNIDVFPEEIGEYDILVTFFGTGFDLPMLRQTFRRLPLNTLHVDLCFALRRLGYRGGLKAIEQKLGIARSGETTGLGGMDAVRLWQEFRRGRQKSLSTLLAYNAEDILNLEPLLQFAVEQLSKAGV